MQFGYWQCNSQSDPGDKLLSDFHFMNSGNEIN